MKPGIEIEARRATMAEVVAYLESGDLPDDSAKIEDLGLLLRYQRRRERAIEALVGTTLWYIFLLFLTFVFMREPAIHGALTSAVAGAFGADAGQIPDAFMETFIGFLAAGYFCLSLLVTVIVYGCINAANRDEWERSSTRNCWGFVGFFAWPFMLALLVISFALYALTYPARALVARR